MCPQATRPGLKQPYLAEGVPAHGRGVVTLIDIIFKMQYSILKFSSAEVNLAYHLLNFYRRL